MISLSRQEVFDKVYEHITKQGGPSFVIETDEDGWDDLSCVYRGTNGRMCAAGPFLKDSDVEEGAAFFALESVEDNFTEDTIVYIADMQRIHDDCLRIGWDNSDEAFMVRWKRKMKDYADKYNLKHNID